MKKPAFGQNFLIDKNIARKIIEEANIAPRDKVIEIGPGKGILTELILEKTGNLTAVEIDKNLAYGLKTKIESKFSKKQLRNFKIVINDFIRFKIPKTAPVKYISNLPYYAASPIIRKAISSGNWKTAVFTVQKEVAERITAQPGSKAYGILTLLIRYYSSAQKVFNIGTACFNPQPRVDSTVISLSKLAPPKNIPFCNFKRIVTSAFSQRRKTILNSLSAGLAIDKQVVRKVLIRNGISVFLRPEQVPFEKYLLMTLDIKNIIL